MGARNGDFSYFRALSESLMVFDGGHTPPYFGLGGESTRGSVAFKLLTSSK